MLLSPQDDNLLISSDCILLVESLHTILGQQGMMCTVSLTYSYKKCDLWLQMEVQVYNHHIKFRIQTSLITSFSVCRKTTSHPSGILDFVVFAVTVPHLPYMANTKKL